jgi:archaellum component FlaC
MEIMELQRTAENVIDLEARIVNWHGSVAGWMNELSRLGETIENLSDESLCDKDPIQEAFLNSLQHKTNHCREQVLSRADIMEMVVAPILPRYY